MKSILKTLKTFWLLDLPIIGIPPLEKTNFRGSFADIVRGQKENNIDD